MKKFMYLTLSLAIVFSLAACGNEAKKQEEGTSEGSQESTETESTETESTEKESGDFTLPSVEEQVLYDQNGLKLTVNAGDLSLAEFGTDVNIPITFENNSDLTYNIFLNNVEINGLTLGSFAVLVIDSETPAGTTKDTVIQISSTSLEESGISTIGDIKFDIDLSPEEGDRIKIENFELVTSLSGTVEQKVDVTGNTLYDQDGIKLVVKDKLVDTVIGPAVVYYFENDSDNYVKFRSGDVFKINGKEEDTSFISGLKPHSKTIITETYMLEEPIKTIEFSLSADDADFMGNEIIAPFDVKIEF